MNSLRKACLIGTVALLLGGAAAVECFGQLQQQPELLRRLWPFGQDHRPVPLLREPVAIAQKKPAKKRLVAPFVPRLVDINHCTLEQLQNLPGVGPSMGAHLMAGRPYRNYEDLERDDVPLNVVQGLRGKIVFGP